MRKILALFITLISLPTIAADNQVTLTPGAGVTMRTIDIGAGVQSSVNILGSSTGAAIYGTAGTANANVLTIQGIASGTAVPVSLTSTTITGTVAATQSGTWTNTVTQATAASLNATVVGTGTFAVQAAQSGTWNITNISGTVSLPTGASTAAKQPALGTAGTASTDVITIQGIASMTPLLVTPAANSAINNAQINGVTILAGNGVTGTGSQRVTIASDNTAIAGVGAVATGAAPPTNAIYLGANASGATGGLVAGLIQCDQKAIYDASTNGSTELVALTSGRSIYICGKTFFAAGTVNVKLIYGTGTACATGATNLTPAYQFTAQVGLVEAVSFYRGSKTASANALCINTSAGVAVQAEVYYSIL